MEQYLSEQPRSCDSKIDLLEHWRSIESIYPTVARMARDVLAIFLTGVAIERQFNIGRDTCQYRRGKLQGGTIQKIMILKDANPALSDQGLCSDEHLSVEWEDEEAIQKHENIISRQAITEEKLLAQSLTFDHSAVELDNDDQPPAARTRYFENRR
jgi:hypothetical protein